MFDYNWLVRSSNTTMFFTKTDYRVSLLVDVIRFSKIHCCVWRSY